MCIRCQEELLRAKGKKINNKNCSALLRPGQWGNVRHLAVTQPLRFPLFEPLQPGPVLGPPPLRTAVAQGYLKKWGEEEGGKSYSGISLGLQGGQEGWNVHPRLG